MAEVKVLVQKIHEIKEHPNADRMELAIIGGEGGYQTCVRKGSFKAGDKCIYFPVDSVIPGELEGAIFGKGAKVTLKDGRIRTLKLRGALSQGMAEPMALLDHTTVNSMDKFIPVDPEDLPVGFDLTEKLGVTKYEPPQKAALPVERNRPGILTPIFTSTHVLNVSRTTRRHLRVKTLWPLKKSMAQTSGPGGCHVCKITGGID